MDVVWCERGRERGTSEGIWKLATGRGGCGCDLESGSVVFGLGRENGKGMLVMD